jgi:hypothetical protein
MTGSSSTIKMRAGELSATLMLKSERPTQGLLFDRFGRYAGRSRLSVGNDWQLHYSSRSDPMKPGQRIHSLRRVHPNSFARLYREQNPIK